MTLRDLEQAASAGPWQWLDSDDGDPDSFDELQDGRGEMVASGFRDDVLRDEIFDGRFCAAARTGVPLLLALETAVRSWVLATDAPQPPDTDLDTYYEAGPTVDEAEVRLRDALAAFEAWDGAQSEAGTSR